MAESGEGGERHGDEEDGSCEDGGVVAGPLGESGLEDAVPGCDESAELVGEAGSRGADGRGRQLSEVGGDDSPCALDHELHQDGAGGEGNGGVPVGPERDNRQGKERGGDDGALAPPRFRVVAEDEAAGDGPEAVEYADEADGLGGEVHLDREKGGVDVLGAVGKAHEGGHEKDEKEEAREEFEDVWGDEAGGGWGFGCGSAGEPDGAFLDAGLDVEDEECGAGADEEEAAPSDPVKEEAEGSGGEDGAESVSLLKDAAEGAASFFGEGFKGEGGADAPLAAHGDAEECAKSEQDGEGGCKGASELDDGEAEDIEDEDGSASVAVGEQAEEERACGAEGLRPENGGEDGGGAGVEVGGDGFDTEDEQEEVEAVEGPAEEGSKKGVALRRRQMLEVMEERHHGEDSRRLAGREIRHGGMDGGVGCDLNHVRG
jgi:hypothetical protein